MCPFFNTPGSFCNNIKCFALFASLLTSSPLISCYSSNQPALLQSSSPSFSCFVSFFSPSRPPPIFVSSVPGVIFNLFIAFIKIINQSPVPQSCAFFLSDPHLIGFPAAIFSWLQLSVQNRISCTASLFCLDPFFCFASCLTLPQTFLSISFRLRFALSLPLMLSFPSSSLKPFPTLQRGLYIPLCLSPRGLTQ